MVECPVCGQVTNFMTASKVARLMGVVPRTVTEWCNEGKFQGADLIKGIDELQKQGVWRIPAASVLQFIKEREEKRISQG